MPFVSVYARGILRGCYGSDEGAPGERIVRAFLRAIHDARFPPLERSQRSELSVELAYACAPTPVNA